MIRGEVHAFEIEDLNAAPGSEIINRARWAKGPVEQFDAIEPGMVLEYAKGEVHLRVLAVEPIGQRGQAEYKVTCGVLKPSTRRAFKLLRALPWWKWEYADEPLAEPI